MKTPHETRRPRRTRATAPVEPVDLPTDPAAFYAARIDLDEIGPAPETECPPALKRLGPPPFAHLSFPLIGFLATLYDHVAECARKMIKP